MKFKTTFIHTAVAILLLIITGCSSSSNCNLTTGNAPIPAPTPIPTPAIRKIVEVTVVYLDAVPIEGVKIDSDYPGLDLSNAVTNLNGQFSFDATNIPDGTAITFTFTKDRHIIQSVTLVIGEGGIVVDEHTVLYPVETQGYIPFSSGDEGRTLDFFQEEIALLNSPVDAVISPDGKKLYISDSSNRRIRVCDMSDGSISTLAGGPISGYELGIGTAAKFAGPCGLALTKDGKSLYVADQTNHIIYKIDTDTAEVSLFAGTPKVSGSANGDRLSSNFYVPFELVFSSDETILYVCDTYNRKVRKIDMATGAVSDLGTAFGNNIYGVTLANDGTKDILYVSYSYGYQIYSMDVISGAKTFIAGSTSGNADGIGSAAKFRLPTGIVASGDNKYLYITDYSNSSIRKIDLSNNNVTTLAGSAGPGYANGPAITAQFLNPYSLGISSDNKTLYVADYKNNRIRAVDTQSGETVKIAGGGRAGFYDGPGGNSTFFFSGNVYGVTVTADGSKLYVTDVKYIWEILTATKTARQVGFSCYNEQNAITQSIGYGSTNRAVSQKAILSKDEKTLYIADASLNLITSLEISSGAKQIIAGSGEAAYADGIGSAAKFNQPDALALSPDGTSLYVTDANNHRIRKVVISTGEVTTIAGSSAGYLDADGIAARFNLPTGVEISPDGEYLYIADAYNARIRRIDLGQNNKVETLAGSGVRGRKDGIGTAAEFSDPRSLAISSDGNLLLISDWSNASIRSLDLASLAVSSIAGGVNYGFADGTGAQAIFSGNDGICITRDSSIIYALDRNNGMLRMIVASTVKTYGE